jgi:Putative peptidoglycan binding domain
MAPSRHFVLLVLLLLPGALLKAQTKPASSSSSASGARKTKSSAARTTKRSTSSTRTSSKARAKRVAARRAPPPPVEQSHPTKDRYAEIQTALAKAGYYSGPEDGSWDDDSVKALQQFQQDQGLEPTGKIDSLTLIRLDLGPHYETDGTAPASAAKPAG